MAEHERERVLWITADGARALARRIAVAGDRLSRVEGRADPKHPEEGLLWTVVMTDDDDEESAAQRGVEAPLNDTFWCPPRCW